MFRKFGIEPGEGRVFAWGAAALALAGCADVSVKNVSETFFNKRVGVEWLPLAYLINSILLVGTTYVVGRIAARSNRPRLLPRVLFFLAALLIPLWVLVRAEVISAFVLLVLASKQFQSIALLVFWVSMGDLLNGRQAKRLFAPMMAGYTLGTIVGSFASDPIGRAIGIDGLLPVAAGCFALSGLLTLPLRRLVSRRFEPGPSPRPRSASSSRLSQLPGRSQATARSLWAESQLFRLLFVGAAASGLVGPMLYFQFQYVTNLASADEESLLALYSQFRGWINIGVLATQLAVTSNLYRRIGIPLSLVLSPVVYLIGFLGMSIRLNLTAGVGAFAGTKLQDAAVYDPAMRILFNLFPERDRSRAAALLEGPVKRAGGALGNLLSMGAIHVASAVAVGYLAIPIVLIWLGTSIVLWRSYPALLLRTVARAPRQSDEFDLSEMIDPNTMRVLSAHLTDRDPGPAIQLIAEAEASAAAGALAAAIRDAPDASRPRLIVALERSLRKSAAEPIVNPEAAADLAAVLATSETLRDDERADLIHAYSCLAAVDDPGAGALLEGAVAHASSGVRLAARAALERRGGGRGSSDLNEALERGVASPDEGERRVARRELRTNLLRGEPDSGWALRLAVLTRNLIRDTDRAEVASAVAEVAAVHGISAGVVGGEMLDHRDDEDPRVIAAIMRYCGYAGFTEQASWLIEHLEIQSGARGAMVGKAAREALIALGPRAAEALLVELSFGKRSIRDAILPIIRQLEVEEESLLQLYERELQSIRRKLVYSMALIPEPTAMIVRQYLGERADEGLHTALLLLAAIRNEERIVQLAGLLKRAGSGRSAAILFEALDALLSPDAKSQLMPLMRDRSLALRARAAASALGIAVPSVAHATNALLEESDVLTRALATATLLTASQSDRRSGDRRLAASSVVDDHGSVLSPVEIALHLKSLPLFEGLTTRQLMDLAGEVREEAYAPDTTVFREGDTDDCLYLIVDGTVRVTTGETLLSEMGPRSFFGEIAVLEGAARTATITTTRRVRLLRLDRNDLLLLMEEIPAIAICICQTLAKKVRELTDRVRREP